MRIRPMEEQDLDLVLKLAADSVKAPRWTRGDYEKALPSAEATLLARGSWVAEADSQLLGFALARWVRGEAGAEVESVVVDPRYRRQRVGTALIQACMEWATSSGASAVQLEVRASNTAALALYRGLGFVPKGIRRAYYSLPVEDALVLQAPCITFP